MLAPSGGSGIASNVMTQTKEQARAALQSMLNNLDWYQFEKLVALLYEQAGYRVDHKGGAEADGGVDLVVWRAEDDFSLFNANIGGNQRWESRLYGNCAGQ